ncbi:MAG: hypothetical protein COC21_01360 [Verrucomicrobiales bacterium]|nr:MAG: hypothetical protein COC21_01360 [Verrucomicrobiales bacterium]
MKHLLLTTISAVLLVGCGESQSSRLRQKKHNQLNPLPKMQNQKRQQIKHQTSQFTQLSMRAISKP